MDEKYQLLINLVRNHLNGQAPEAPETGDFQGLYEAAAQHKLETFVYAALEGTVHEASAMAAIGGAYHKAVFRDVQGDYIRAQITEELTKAGIDHVFQRGVCLKHDYPVSSMRTMSDMDVLVHSKDLHKLPQVMSALDCVQRPGDGNHRIFSVSPGFTVEFHPNLIHCSSHVGTEINPGWQFVPSGQQTGEQFMTEEGFYLSVMCHLANHFAGGGIGIRFVLDIWVCNHLRTPQPDRDIVEQELQRIGLLNFAKQIEALADWWFSGIAPQEDLSELEEYILTSSSHGDTDRAMLNSVCLSPGGSGFSALWRKVFYPRQDLYDRYDWVKGRPWLLPIAWIVRMWQALTRRRNLVATWGKGTMKFTDDQIQQQREKLQRFGIYQGGSSWEKTKN